MMDNNFEHNSSPLGYLVTINSIIMAAISVSSIKEWVGLIAGLSAIISAIFAIRYYFLQIKKTKDELNAIKKESKESNAST